MDPRERAHINSVVAALRQQGHTLIDAFSAEEGFVTQMAAFLRTLDGFEELPDDDVDCKKIQQEALGMGILAIFAIAIAKIRDRKSEVTAKRETAVRRFVQLCRTMRHILLRAQLGKSNHLLQVRSTFRFTQVVRL